MKFGNKNINRDILHREVFFYSLALLLFSLSLSLFAISVSQFLLAGNWLIEGRLGEKFKKLIKNKAVLIFIGLFTVHLIWLFNTIDFAYAMKDIKIKLPLLILPLVIGTSDSLDKKRITGLIYFFAAGIVISSIIGLGVWLGLTGNEISDYREIAVFISHIRLSLMINTVIFLLLFLIEKNEWVYYEKEKYMLWIVVLYLSAFLFVLRSQTGLVVFCILLGIYIIRFIILTGKFWYKVYVISAFSVLLSFFIYEFNKAYCDFYDDKEVYPLENFTKNGRPYFHNFSQLRYENGHAVWNYYCEEELKKEWNSRSKIDFSSTDKKGNRLSYTLTRYMTSKGLRKDSAGIASLSPEDIAAIENGIPNYIYLDKFSLYSFLYKQIWIYDSYLKGDNPSGHSVSQRFEYLKVASDIICENYWFGTGTGDVQSAFNDYYSNRPTLLGKQWQLRAHNQYVTFFLAFGFTGFILAILSIFLPVIIQRSYRTYSFTIPFAICLVSFINEDTLETQAGVTFFAVFYSLFLVNRNKKTP